FPEDQDRQQGHPGGGAKNEERVARFRRGAIQARGERKGREAGKRQAHARGRGGEESGSGWRHRPEIRGRIHCGLGRQSGSRCQADLLYLHREDLRTPAEDAFSSDRSRLMGVGARGRLGSKRYIYGINPVSEAMRKRGAAIERLYVVEGGASSQSAT